MIEKDTAVAGRAIPLMGRWMKLVQGHIPLRGGPCACQLGIGSLAVSDFEEDLLDYLAGEIDPASPLQPLLDVRSCDRGKVSITELLQRIAREGRGGADVVTVLDRLERSLSSLEDLHR